VPLETGAVKSTTNDWSPLEIEFIVGDEGNASTTPEKVIVKFPDPELTPSETVRVKVVV
jgi:hypothetical protein